MDTVLAHSSRFAVFGLLVVLLAWESVAPFFGFFRGRWGERARHDGINFAFGAVNGLFNATIAASLWWWIARASAAADFGLLRRFEGSAEVELLAALLLLDFWMYWWHRICHVVPVLWRFHRVHHSDPRMDVSTAYRFHPGEMIASALARAPVIALLGVSLEQLLAFEALMFAVVQVQHADVALPTGVDRALRRVFVTPFMHKVHHSDRQPETDSNFCSLFSWWDRVFGTYRERHDPAGVRFGLREWASLKDQRLGGLLLNPFRSIRSKNDVASADAKRKAAGSETNDCK